jgi:cytochrome c2
MTHRYLLPALALLLFTPIAQAVEPSELKPGLVMTVEDVPGNTITAVVTRLEPTVALTLGKGEALHPTLSAGAHQIEWKGYINVVRPGKYVFSSSVLGSVSVEVDGKSVLRSKPSVEDRLTALTGEEVSLKGGVQPFKARFASYGSPARVELFWEGPGFKREPLPHQFLGHLPKQRPESFVKDLQLEHGRLRFEELACVRCHKPDENDKMARGLVDRPGPNLTEVAKRSFPGWIDAWLADPAKLRPHTTMPKMFADTETGKAERYAIVKYLVAIAGNTPLEPVRAPNVSNEYRQSMARGQVLFTVTGCAACHQEPLPKKAARNDEEEKEPLQPEDYLYAAGSPGPTTKYNLGALGSKYRPETLAAYLQNPPKVSPAGRMPHMNLEAREALDLARYLCRVTDETLSPRMPDANGLKPSLIAEQVFEAFGATPEELEKFADQKVDAQWLELGQKLLVTKGCVNCHAVEPDGKAMTAKAKFPGLDAIKKVSGKGCLSDGAHAGKAPEYTLAAKESAALAAFVKDGLTGAGSPSPTHAARLALKRFNCLNCHSRDGEGGIPVELADAMRLMEKAENADDVRPPLLTGIGHKSRTSWLKSVLTGGGRARPWMQLRMPQYGEANVGHLPESLAFLEGTTTDDTVHKVALTTAKIEAGKTIVGKGGLGCISCHDISGIPNTGTRGPDLATINQRVRYEWYDRWLHQPLRMAPGTRMPQAFSDDKSTLTTILKGEATAQADAMWAYLSLGPGLPLPDGMEPPKGLVIAVKDRPELLRTFMTEAGSRAIAVGYPGNVSVAFSADQCRLTYAWAGNFLDASPVWNNRGGAPAKLLGPKFWVAPPGHPWGLTVNPRIPPDFPGRANNPAFGVPLPLEPARIYDGPTAVHFDGYTLDKEGRPTFRYTLTESADAVLKVAETPAPLKSSVATGLRRRFEVEAPGGYQAWFLAGATSKEPRLAGVGEKPVYPLGLNADEVTVAANGTRVILPADGDRAMVLELVGSPAGTTWRFVKSGSGWLAVVRLPDAKAALRASFTLNTWALPKDDEGLLKGLTAK